MKQETNEALTRLMAMNDPLVMVTDIAPIIGDNPQSIRSAAKDGSLGFNVIVVGNRVKIPRIPFLRYLGYE